VFNFRSMHCEILLVKLNGIFCARWHVPVYFALVTTCDVINGRTDIFFRWFERLTMTVILFNCVTLGMFQPCEDGNCASQRCKILKVSKTNLFVPRSLVTFATLTKFTINVGTPTECFTDWGKLNVLMVDRF